MSNTKPAKPAKTAVSKQSKVPNAVTGAAGVYAVATEVSRRGFVAAVTSRSAKGVDVLVTGKDVTKTAAIQVKTNRSTNGSWFMNKSDEAYISESMFYVFVSYSDIGKEPVFYVYKSADVAARISKSHQDWLAKPSKNGKPHKDGALRSFEIGQGEEAGRWELLGIEGRIL